MSQDDDITSELGLAASEDAVIDSLAERAEKEIISSHSTEKNLIGYCAPFLSKLCRNISLMQKVIAISFFRISTYYPGLMISYK